MADEANDSAEAPQGGMFQRLSIAEKVIALLGAAALVVQTVFTIINTYNTSKIDDLAKRIDSSVKVSAEDRERANLNATITKDVFEQLRQIQDADEPDLDGRIERLVVGAAYVSAIPDPEIRAAFRGAVKDLTDRTLAQIASTRGQASPQVEARLDAQKAVLEDLAWSLDSQQSADKREVVADAQPPEAAGAGQPVQWSNYDFDIFWCEGTPAEATGRNVATAVARLRNEDTKAAGAWRVRPLPRLANARPDFRVTGYQIHISSDDELPFAERLQARANDLLKRAKLPGQFAIRRSAEATRWYVSVFACPG